MSKLGCFGFRIAGVGLATSLMLLEGATGAGAVTYNVNNDLRVDWSNTLSYNLGIRGQGQDSDIVNNPVFSESEDKFPNAGNIVTNRLSDLSELDIIYKGFLGVRFSGSAWKDFAYSDNVNNNAYDVAPGTPYTSLCSYCSSPGVASGHYSGYTNHYYVAGAQLLDAFGFGNFDIDGHSVSVKVGRLTRYWGNSVFFGSQGISYSQNASDNIKGAAAPGSQAKELSIPRFQFLVSGEVAPNVTVEGQYFGEFYGNRLPEGGTYLGTAGFLFRGPTNLEGAVPNVDGIAPSAFHANYGVRASWSPPFLGGVLAGYFRHFDEVQPWSTLLGIDPTTGFTSNRLVYNQNVKLYGLSLDRTIGNYSVGLEASYRQRTALNSALQPVASNLENRRGATGDTINLLANTIAGLTPTKLWQTGTLIGEVAFTHLIGVDDNASQYAGIGYAGNGCTHGNWTEGCSTTDSLSVAGQFDPQWLQVFPGIDLDAPIFAEYGVIGNAASLGGGVSQGAIVYTAGVHAFIQQRYNVTLQWNGYHAHHSDNLTNVAQANGVNVPTGTAGFPSYYATGNGAYFYNDRGWISLTASVSF